MDTPVYPTRIALEQALQLVAAQAVRQRMPIETVPLTAAQGCVLAEDTHAPHPLPPLADTPPDGIAPHAADVPAAGDLALRSGTPLGAAQLAVLAEFDAAQIAVRRPPRVAVIAIGSGPVSPGFEQTRESSAEMLAALARTSGLRVVAQACMHDDPGALRAALLDAAIDADIVVTSGGVSMGEADHLPRVLPEIGEIHFNKVRLQPGTSMLFGQIGACLYFGLPGDSVAAAVTFRVFVRFAVRAMLGITQVPEPVRARLAEALHKRHADAEFVRCAQYCDADGVQWVTPRPRQDSHILRDLADADVLALLPEGERDYRRGDVVTLWPV